jgi:hypothetical protein
MATGTLFDLFPLELKEEVVNLRLSKVKQISKPKEFAFPRLKKLPLDSKRNILSALNHFFNVKGPTEQERAEAFKKVLNKAEEYQICTMGFNKQYTDVCLSNKQPLES